MNELSGRMRESCGTCGQQCPELIFSATSLMNVAVLSVVLSCAALMLIAFTIAQRAGRHFDTVPTEVLRLERKMDLIPLDSWHLQTHNRRTIGRWGADPDTWKSPRYQGRGNSGRSAQV